MELFFRKYFWTVTLLFLALVAFMSASTVNAFVEWKISGVPSASAQLPALARRNPAVETPEMPSLEKLARLSGLPLPEPEPDVLEPNQAAVDLNAPPVKTSLRVKLLGTLIAGDPRWSIASIQDVVTQKSETYMIGDLIQGAEILEIERTQVLILNNNRREYINAEPGDGSGPPLVAAMQPPVRPDAPQGALGTGITKTSEGQYEVPRPEIDKTLANLNDVAMQARIVPAFKDGVAQGFKLFSIRPDSIYAKIGVQNGDVIRRINGYDLNSPEKALEVYSKLKESSRIDIEIERNGSVIRNTYNIR
jgi:general secretion pathway protein C